MVVLSFCVFCLISSINCYVGVQRYFNGTDIEFYKIKSDGACEKVFAGNSWFRPNNSDLCGYPCLPNGNRAASVYKDRSQSTACQYDYEIMEEEKCLVNIGNISKNDAIQTLETSSFDTADLHESTNNSLTRLSRCRLRESGCSVKYRNITSQWQPFRHSNCFKFDVTADDHNAVAQVTIDCLEKEKSTLSGQMFRIELTCRIDEQSRNFNSCLLFKVSGTYIEKSGESLISPGCMVPPVIPTNPTSPATKSSRTTVIKNGDNHDDDEVFFEPFVWVIIALVFFPILLLVAIVIYVKCHGKCRCRKKKNYEIGISNEQNGISQNVVFIDDATSLEQTYNVPNKSNHDVNPPYIKTGEFISTVSVVPTAQSNPGFEEDNVSSKGRTVDEDGYEDPDKYRFCEEENEREEKSGEISGEEKNNNLVDKANIPDNWKDKASGNSGTSTSGEKSDSLKNEVFEHFGLDEDENYYQEPRSSVDKTQPESEEPCKISNLLDEHENKHIVMF